MTKRNRWLKKQERKIQRLKAKRKEYALRIAKYIHERDKLIHSSLYQKMLDYAQGKQDIKAYKKAFGNPRPMPDTELQRIWNEWHHV